MDSLSAAQFATVTPVVDRRSSKCRPEWHCEYVQQALATTQIHLDNKAEAVKSSEENANDEMLQVLTDHAKKQVLNERSAIDKVLQDAVLKNEAYNQAVVHENQDLKLQIKNLELKLQSTQAECLELNQKVETAETVVTEQSAIVDALRKKHDEERHADVTQACATFEHKMFELQSRLEAHHRQNEEHEAQVASWRALNKSHESVQSELREKINSKDQQLRTKDHALLAKDHELQTKDQELQAIDSSLQAKDEQLQVYAEEIKVKDETISQLRDALKKTSKESNEKLEALHSDHAKERAAFSSQASEWEQYMLSHAANKEHIFKVMHENGSKFGEYMKDMQGEISKLSEENCKLHRDASEAQRRWQSYEEDERPALNKLIEKLQLEKAQAKAKEENSHCGRRRSHVELLRMLGQVHGVMTNHFGDGVSKDSPDASTIDPASEEEGEGTREL